MSKIASLHKNIKNKLINYANSVIDKKTEGEIIFERYDELSNISGILITIEYLRTYTLREFYYKNGEISEFHIFLTQEEINSIFNIIFNRTNDEGGGKK